MQTILPAALEMPAGKPRFRHQADRLADAKKLPGQVDCDDGVPLVERHVDERRVVLHTGIGDENVDAAEMPDKVARHRRNLVSAETSAANDAAATLDFAISATNASAASGCVT